MRAFPYRVNLRKAIGAPKHELFAGSPEFQSGDMRKDDHHVGRVPRIRCKDLVFWVFDLVFITCIVLETRKVFKQNTQGFGKL